MSSDAEQRVRLLVHALAGTLLVLLAIFADPILGRERAWGFLETLTALGGTGVILTGVALRGRPAVWTTNLSLAVVAGFVTIGMAEGAVRVLDIDVAQRERSWQRLAPYYRQPTEPTGEVYFRRPGPDTWTGQVINTQMQLYRVTPNPYENEPVITVRYDSLGFRVLPGVSDWEVVVTGDSFTEMGYLPDEQTYAARLSEHLRTPVRNLGVSQTGPLTHLSYLRDYGITRTTRHTVIAFFEGNDLWDIVAEYAALLRFRSTGERDYRRFERGNSVLQALDAGWAAFRRPPMGPEVTIHAYFSGRHGEIPVTLAYTPATPAEAMANSDLMSALEHFFEQYRALAQARGVTPWLAFMPTKLRASYGRLRIVDGEYAHWRPADLPGLINDLATRHGVRFIDLTPSLIETSEKTGEIMYNTIYDTHLNARGAAVVAEELARHLAAASADGTY